MPRDYEPDRRGMADLFESRDLQNLCMAVAWDLVPRVAAVTPRDTGDTAASTRAEADRGPGGIAGAKVVQGGAGVPQHFGNARTSPQGHLHDALGGLNG